MDADLQFEQLSPVSSLWEEERHGAGGVAEHFTFWFIYRARGEREREIQNKEIDAWVDS